MIIKSHIEQHIVAANLSVVSCETVSSWLAVTNFPYRATSVSASNVMKLAECRTLYHAGSVPEITLWGQLRRLPLLLNLLRKVKHTLHFCTETACSADRNRV